MNLIKIGIVEDEVIIAEDIQLLLTSLGYKCLRPCGKYDKAIEMLKNEQPDLVILDVNLGGDKDGIDIAQYIRLNMDIPFIFLTANGDQATVERAKITRPNAYLIKPFNKIDLYSALEIALYNYNDSNPSQYKAPNTDRGQKILKNSLFVKDGDYFHKVLFDDILYLSSEHVYIELHTAQRKFLIRGNLQEYLDTLNSDHFFRVHRSYVVNISRIEKINSTSIIVGGQEIPIARNNRESLLSMLNIR